MHLSLRVVISIVQETRLPKYLSELADAILEPFSTRIHHENQIMTWNELGLDVTVRFFSHPTKPVFSGFGAALARRHHQSSVSIESVVDDLQRNTLTAVGAPTPEYPLDIRAASKALFPSKASSHQR